MKILVADKLSDTASKELTALGAEVISKPDLSAEELPAAIGDAEIVIVRSTKVTKATIDAATALKVIIRAGAGVNTIDCDHIKSIYKKLNVSSRAEAAVLASKQGLV